MSNGLGCQRPFGLEQGDDLGEGIIEPCIGVLMSVEPTSAATVRLRSARATLAVAAP
ncbi:MAG: hypothetical protein P8P20_04425 [Acidimicrobiales bacterium]|nr:hypothetical protein [Acidimicrobiales bacterium]